MPIGMTRQQRWIFFAWAALLPVLMNSLTGCSSLESAHQRAFEGYALNFDTLVDAPLQSKVEAIDARLRATFGMTTAQTAVGVLDLQRLRLSMIRPDRIEYAAIWSR